MAVPTVALGLMRNTVMIKKPTQVGDGRGGTKTSLATFESNWMAAVESLSQTETASNGTVNPVASHKFTGRFLPGVTTDCVLHFDGRVFGVTGVANVDERNNLLQITAKE